MTVKELRAILFNVENQEMSIKELRGILFQIEEQDQEKEIDGLELARITRK